MLRDAEHESRVSRAVAHALEHVPFYASYARETDLRSLPLLTRDRVRPTLPKVWVPAGRDAKAELASGKLAVVETGTANARVRILFDRAWWRAQEARALDVNPVIAAARAGERGRYREAVLWVPERGTGSCGSGDPEYEERLEGDRLHLNSRQDPTFWSEVVMTRMLDELSLHETVGLLADPFYLDELARHAAKLGRRLDVRGFVALTRSRPTSAHRAAIAKVFAGPVIDVLGSRETGTLFVEGADHLLHHAPLTTHVELLPAKVETPGAKDIALVVVTTLDREVQPLVRYVLGDLVQVAKLESTSGAVPPLTSVEGRIDDAVLRPDGAIVTAGAIDRALAPLDLRGYQVTQHDPASAEVEVVGGSPDAVAAALAPLFGGVRTSAREATAIGVEPNGKVRSVRRHVPLALSSVFEGCEATS